MKHLVISVLIPLDQELSENVRFVWSKTSYSGDKWRYHACGLTDKRRESGIRNYILDIGVKIKEIWIVLKEGRVGEKETNSKERNLGKSSLPRFSLSIYMLCAF